MTDDQDAAAPEAPRRRRRARPAPVVAPAPAADALAGGDAPPRLFTQNAITLAVVLGSPIAGAVLYAWNLEKLAQRGEAIRAFLVGTVITVTLALLAVSLPPDVGRVLPGASIGLAFAAHSAAHRRFGPFLTAAEKRNVATLSGWWALPASILGWLMLAVMSLALSPDAAAESDARVASPAALPSVSFPGDHSVYYEGEATREEAQRVGEELVREGIFPPAGPPAGGQTSATLLRKGSTYTITFHLLNGAWNEPKLIDAFTCFGGEVRERLLDGNAVFVVLRDSAEVARRSIEAPSGPEYVERCGPSQP